MHNRIIFSARSGAMFKDSDLGAVCSYFNAAWEAQGELLWLAICSLPQATKRRPRKGQNDKTVPTEGGEKTL